MAAPLPSPSGPLVDPARLAVLRASGLLDAPAEEAFDRLTRLAARLLNAPVALVSLVDDCRQFFKSAVGLPEPWASRRETPLSHSFCQHVVISGEPLVIRDARQDPRVRDNLAIAELGVLAYLGIPLLSGTGHVLGSFCVIDGEPRRWTDDQVETMRELAASAMTEIELRGEIARHRLTQQVLYRCETHYRAIVDMLRDGVAVLDDTGCVTWVNPSAAQMLGCAEEELLGHSLLDFVAEVDREQTRPHFAAGTSVGDEAEIRLRHRTGSEVWVYARCIGSLREADRSQGVVLIYTDISARKRAEEALRESEAKFRAIFEQTHLGFLRLELNGDLAEANPAFRDLLGFRPDELAGRPFTDLVYPEDRPAHLAAFSRLSRGLQDHYHLEKRLQSRDGTPTWVHVTSFLVRDARGEPRFAVKMVEDIRERRRFEEAMAHSQEQLRHMQRIESVGRLAGGVAHDFNNMLAIILGYSEMLLQRLPESSPLHPIVEEIRQAGERSANLTRQLLAFSRKQILQPRVVRIGAIVTEMQKLLGRVIGEDIHLVLRTDPVEGSVRADPGQLEQCLLNLCINSRDAMPRGGTITVETRNAELDEEYTAAHPDAAPGSYVRLSVSDTGEGIPPELLPNIFEPFFTTKPVDAGTGLGLATVYGIVTQSDGHITVESEVGRGTTFHLYLPRFRGSEAAGAPLPEPAPRGRETVLLVEDEAVVRKLLRTVLEEHGYQVLEASHADEALKLARDHPSDLPLLVTDVVMPGGKGGRELAEELLALRPGLRVLFMSGYTDDAVLRHGLSSEQAAFIQKPFLPAALLTKIRDVLGQE